MQIANSHSFRAFRYTNFRRLFPASLLSNIGSWAQFVAQDWLVLELTGSAFILSLVAMLQLAPGLLFSIPSGVVADRFNKRAILIGTNLIGMATALALGMLVLAESVQIWHVMALAFVAGTANAIDGPVRQAFNSEVVGPENVANAVALISANVNVARMVGPAASGLLISAIGTGPAFLINAASFVYMAIVLVTMRSSELFKSEIPIPEKPFREGIEFLKSRPDLQATLLMIFVAAGFGLNFNFLNAVMAKNVFELNATGFGFLGTAVGVGSLTAALISTRLEHLRTPKFVAQASVGFGLVLSIAAWMPNVWGYASLLPLFGFGVLLTMIAGNGVMQANTETHLRGRVLGWFMLAFNAPLGQPVIGWLSILVSDRFAISAAGGLTVAFVGAIWMLYRRRIEAQKLY